MGGFREATKNASSRGPRASPPPIGTGEPDGPANRCGIWPGGYLPGATSSTFEVLEVSHSDRVASKKSNLLQASLGGRGGGESRRAATPPGEPRGMLPLKVSSQL
jgi:hypothetical protein